MASQRDHHVVESAPTTDAFVEWCHLYGPAVHAYLSRRAGRQGADDLFGEVWLRAFSARESYDAALGDPLPWVYGIARNVLRAHWRTHTRAEAVLASVPADPWSEADDRLHAAAQLAGLRSALGLLSDEEREVLLLVAWERLTPTEVAHTLGIPAGTARSRLHRARQLMREGLHAAAAPRPALTLTQHEEIIR